MTRQRQTNNQAKAATLGAFSIFSLTCCTQQIPSEFQLQQQNQTFTGQTKVQINTKIDLLWVVDNSSSMDVEQQKLRAGFAAFAQKYMQPSWDIRVAVIPTDLYLANSEFNGYRNKVISASTGYASTYINAHFSPAGTIFTNPSTDGSLISNVGGVYKFTNGVKYADLVPAWGFSDNTYSLLTAGLHDGPIAGLCNEYLPYLMWGQTNCNGSGLDSDVSETQATAINNCINNGGSDTTVCVNTVENNQIHSGAAIISTLGADPATLVKDFTLNITTGTAGGGSERGMQSVLQLIADNEKTGSAQPFFRAGSTRGIIFASDEEDQSMPQEPTPLPANFSPFTHYFCDQNSLLNGSITVSGTVYNNNGVNISGAGGVCCTGGSCQYGAVEAGGTGISCNAGGTGGAGAYKTIDGLSYNIGVCPNPSKLLPVSTVKTDLDNFFLGLDGAGSTNPNYFVVSIVPLTGASIQALQTARNVDDAHVIADSGGEGLTMWAVDRGDRYIALGNLVGNGSTSLDLDSSDYSSVLDAIGNELTQQKGTFTLTRAPTNQEQTTVEVVHADGSITIVNANQYTLNGSTLVITDLNVILGFQSTDQIEINYQPLTSV